MGIKVRGRHVTLTDEHADLVIQKAEDLGVTPEEVFNAALEEAMKPEHWEELQAAILAEEGRGAND